MRMKVLSLAISCMAMIGMASCSSSDDVTGSKDDNNGGTSYIAVNIVNPQSTVGFGAKGYTRAETYVAGEGMESAIQKVRFYFFNSDGSPYLLTNSNPVGVNWLDVDTTRMQNPTREQSSTRRVESVSQAILLINGAEGNAPTSIIAVCNPNSLTNVDVNSTLSVLGDGTKSTNQLEDASLQTRTFYDGDYGTYFVMSNSVFLEGGSTFRCATPTTGKIKASAEEARQDPVDIYVERLAAKVTCSHGSNSNWSDEDVDGDGESEAVYNLGDFKYLDGSTTATKTLYAVIKGWGLSDEQRNGKVEKDITNYASWGTNNGQDVLGFPAGTPWNSDNYYRSFWEESVLFNNTTSDNPINYPFSSYFASNGGKRMDGTGLATLNGNVAYTMPNTPDYTSTPQTAEEANRNANRTYRTKVLLAAQLMYKDDAGNWTPAEVCTYRGEDFLGEDAVKTAILGDVRNSIVKRTADGWANLDASDIRIDADTKTVTEGGKVININSYQVTPVLSSSNRYFLGTLAQAQAAGDGATTVSADEANVTLHQYAPFAEIRKNGYTYYYTSIRHLGEDENKLGYFGVVRNHWYQVNVTDLTGYGTPVYTPEKVIIPVTPSDQNIFMAARINVEQWRIVANDYSIDSTPRRN